MLSESLELQNIQIQIDMLIRMEPYKNGTFQLSPGLPSVSVFKRGRGDIGQRVVLRFFCFCFYFCFGLEHQLHSLRD